MFARFATQLSHYIRSESGTAQIDSAVLIAGLLGMGMVLVSTVSQGMEAAQHDANKVLRAAVVAPGFDRSPCPDGWAEKHASNSGVGVQQIEDWHNAERASLSTDALLEALRAHDAAPLDFRYRDPLRLAHLQIMMCIAQEREVSARQ